MAPRPPTGTFAGESSAQAVLQTSDSPAEELWPLSQPQILVSSTVLVVAHVRCTLSESRSGTRVAVFYGMDARTHARWFPFSLDLTEFTTAWRHMFAKCWFFFARWRCFRFLQFAYRRWRLFTAGNDISTLKMNTGKTMLFIQSLRA